MNNLFTEEEASRPVTYGELAIILEQVYKSIIEGKEDISVATMESVTKIMDTLIDKLKELEYKRVRDVRYFVNLLSIVNHLDKDSMFENYKNWCAEYDKLNKSEGREVTK